MVDYLEPQFLELLARHNEALSEMEAVANRPLVEVEDDGDDDEE